MIKAPKTWTDCQKLLADADLVAALQVRLVQLAFDTNTTVAVKAIEILMATPRVGVDVGMSGLSDEELLQAEQATENMLKQLRGQRGRGNGE